MRRTFLWCPKFPAPKSCALFAYQGRVRLLEVVTFVENVPVVPEVPALKSCALFDYQGRVRLLETFLCSSRSF